MLVGLHMRASESTNEIECSIMSAVSVGCVPCVTLGYNFEDTLVL